MVYLDFTVIEITSKKYKQLQSVIFGKTRTAPIETAVKRHRSNGSIYTTSFKLTPQ